jgi:hypothetical protein
MRDVYHDLREGRVDGMFSQVFGAEGPHWHTVTRTHPCAS